jgi:hypothetical protein
MILCNRVLPKYQGVACDTRQGDANNRLLCPVGILVGILLAFAFWLLLPLIALNYYLDSSLIPFYHFSLFFFKLPLELALFGME